MFTQTTMMPDEYGCVVANRFGKLLDDDADPFDLLSKAETEKDEQKKKKDSQKKNKPKKPGQKESQKERRVTAMPDGQEALIGRKPQVGGPVTNENRGGVPVAQRGTRRVVFGERRANQEDNPQDFIPKPSYDADLNSKSRGGFGSGRGGRGGGYSRNFDNFNLRGKREYERHSGTGISPEEKRGGRGPWNWGTVQDTMGDMMEVTSDVPIQSPEPQVSAAAAGGEDQVSEVDGEVVVQVAMEMTLDEWKALQEISRPKAEFNLRQADTKVPTKARVIHQSKRIEIHKESLEEMEEEAHFLRRSMNDITSRMDINFGSLGRPARGGRGRGGRGGLASPRPEKDQTKSEKVDVLAPNPDDPEDFPALIAGQ